MLVLSRKTDEAIRIGENIIIRVLAVKDGQIKLGIEAPKELRVFRSEIYDQVQRQNQVAAQADKNSVMQVAAQLAKLKAPPPEGNITRE